MLHTILSIENSPIQWQSRGKSIADCETTTWAANKENQNYFRKWADTNHSMKMNFISTHFSSFADLLVANVVLTVEIRKKNFEMYKKVATTRAQTHSQL